MSVKLFLRFKIVVNHPNSYFSKLILLNEFVFLANLQAEACNFTKIAFFWRKDFPALQVNSHKHLLYK